MKVIPDVREAAVSFEKDIVFGSELDQVFVLVIVVGAEGNLLVVSPRALALARRPMPGLRQG